MGLHEIALAWGACVDGDCAGSVGARRAGRGWGFGLDESTLGTDAAAVATGFGAAGFAAAGMDLAAVGASDAGSDDEGPMEAAFGLPGAFVGLECFSR